jgi:hypothetical protein
VDEFGTGEEDGEETHSATVADGDSADSDAGEGSSDGAPDATDVSTQSGEDDGSGTEPSDGGSADTTGTDPSTDTSSSDDETTATTSTDTGEDGAETGGDPGSTACEEVVTLSIDADEAFIAGDWEVGFSSIAPEEGAVVYPLGSGASGSATFAFEAPCSDSWTIWVRGLDNDFDDSFLINVSNTFVEPVIFDVDCEGGGFFPQASYVWAPLNARQAGSDCGLDNPLAFEAGPGTVEVVFTERELGAISEIVVTNDPDLVP